MNAEELRVIEALQAHAGGLIVTEQDTHIAQGKLQETLEGTRPPRPLLLLTAAAVVALVAAIVGFATLRGDDESSPPPLGGDDKDSYADFLTGSDPTAELLQGIWRVDAEEGATLFMRFRPPNRYSMAGPEGILFDDPAIQGTYVIDGDRITVTADPGSRFCAGLRFSMRASVPEPHVAHLVYVDDGPDQGCASPGGTRTILQQLLPTHADVAGWGPPAKGDADFPDAGWHSPQRQDAFFGDWLVAGGGYLLEVNPDGAYHVADDSGESVDSGQWTWREGEFTLTSDSGSRTCSAGDRLVQKVEHLDITFEDLAGTRFMRTTVQQQDSCDRPWAGTVSLRF